CAQVSADEIGGTPWFVAGRAGLLAAAAGREPLAALGRCRADAVPGAPNAGPSDLRVRGRWDLAERRAWPADLPDAAEDGPLALAPALVRALAGLDPVVERMAWRRTGDALEVLTTCRLPR
ncbi:MAG: hypothetical protein HZA54_14220, partial [Planctomycetes bacterium]|nr:hypothetical protein [Planctomycetota bacterium]